LSSFLDALSSSYITVWIEKCYNMVNVDKDTCKHDMRSCNRKRTKSKDSNPHSIVPDDIIEAIIVVVSVTVLGKVESKAAIFFVE